MRIVSFGVAASLALALTPGPAWASLALALVTTDRIVVASDSRTWDVAADRAAGDTARKIDTKDTGYAFLMTGFPGAFEAWRQSQPVAGEPARDLARRILAAVQPGRDPEEFTIGVVRYGVPVDAYFARVVLHPDRRVETLQEGAPAPPFSVALGWDQGGAAKTARTTALLRELEARPSEQRMIELASHTLDAAAAQSPKVGGPTHLAVVDAAGARWQTERRLHWNGTHLTVASANLIIDENGVRIAPADSPDYSTLRSYGFNVSDGLLGLGGNDGATNGRDAQLRSTWTGDCTPGVGGRCGASVALDAYANDNGVAATSGAASFSVSAEAGTSGNGFGVASVSVLNNNGASYGNFHIYAVPSFQGPTSGSAGSVAGYINVLVGGTPYRIAIYNP